MVDWLLRRGGEIGKVWGSSFVFSAMKRRWKIFWGESLAVDVLAIGITRSWAAPVELGEADWGRDYEAALAASKKNPRKSIAPPGRLTRSVSLAELFISGSICHPLRRLKLMRLSRPIKRWHII